MRQLCWYKWSNDRRVGVGSSSSCNGKLHIFLGIALCLYDRQMISFWNHSCLSIASCLRESTHNCIWWECCKISWICLVCALCKQPSSLYRVSKWSGRLCLPRLAWWLVRFPGRRAENLIYFLKEISSSTWGIDGQIASQRELPLTSASSVQCKD